MDTSHSRRRTIYGRRRLQPITPPNDTRRAAMRTAARNRRGAVALAAPGA